MEPASLPEAGALVVHGASVPAGEAFRWSGRELAGPPAREAALASIVDLATCLGARVCPTADVPCTEDGCERLAVEVLERGRLVAAVRWPSAPDVRFALSIEDDAGRRVALGRSITVDHNGAVAIVEEAERGAFVVVVAAARGTSPFEAAVRLGPVAREGAARELLPDLVTLPPTDLRIADPPGHFVANALALPTNGVARAMGAEACSADEASAGARLCLRFSNAVANLGEGPLDVALSLAAGATHAAGGRFVQRVALPDGGVREVPAGAAEWHAIHAHWHNAGANAFAVHALDPDTRARGALVAEGRKTGMCFADVGIVEPDFERLALPEHQGAQCFNPALDREWSMGLSTGWYDLYPWQLNDQFVDVAGLADGPYLLCSVADAGGFLLESDESNNEGCAAFRLADGAVETLDPLPYHAEPAP